MVPALAIDEARGDSRTYRVVEVCEALPARAWEDTAWRAGMMRGLREKALRELESVTGQPFARAILLLRDWQERDEVWDARGTHLLMVRYIVERTA